MPTVGEYKAMLDKATQANDQPAIDYFNGRIQAGLEAAKQPGVPQGGSALDPIMQGASFGFADEIAGGLSGASSFLKGKGFAPGYETTRDKWRQDAADYRERNPMTSLGLEIGGGLALPGGLLAKLGKGAITGGAAAGALSGFGSGEGSVGDRIDNATIGAVGGAATGGAVSGLSKIGRAILPRITPRAKGPEFAKDIGKLEAAGIKPTAAERISSPSARRSEAVTQGYLGAGDEIAERPQTLMRNLMSMSNFDPAHAGAGELSDAAVKAARVNFNRDYGNIFQGVTVDPNDIVTKVQQGIRQHSALLPSEQTATINALFDDFTNLVERNVSISGEDYQRLRSTLGKRARQVRNGPQSYLAPIYTEMKKGLDTAFEASVPRLRASQLKALNRKYSGFKILEKSAKNPEALNTMINDAFANANRVNRDFLHLARAYQNVLLRGANPSSGTAENIAANSIMPPVMAMMRTGGANLAAKGVRMPELPPAVAARVPLFLGQAGRRAAEQTTDTPQKERERRARRYQRRREGED
jgi:hypothetical protein